MSYRASKQLKRICQYKKADFDMTYMQWELTGALYGQGEELCEQLAYLRRVYIRRWGQKELGHMLRASKLYIKDYHYGINDIVPEATLRQRVARLQAIRGM